MKRSMRRPLTAVMRSNVRSPAARPASRGCATPMTAAGKRGSKPMLPLVLDDVELAHLGLVGRRHRHLERLAVALDAELDGLVRRLRAMTACTSG